MNMIRNLFFIAVWFGVSFTSFAQSKLQVTIKGIKGDKGNIRVGLFNDEEKFLKSAWKGQVVQATNETVIVVFENIPNGVYAVSAIHDENENEKLDSNLIGIPKEGFGFSNNVMGNFGPPGFEKASFGITNEDKKLTVDLKYY
jgi:uncharacterized protein (DUF2141 family)